MSFSLTGNLNINLPSNLNSIINQLQSRLNGVNVNIGINTSNNATRQLNQLSTGLSNVGRQARSTSHDVDKFSDSVTSSLKKFAGFTAIATVFYGVSRAIHQSIDDALNFQNELVKISQVTGTSIKDLSNLTDEVTRLSTSYGVSSTKLLNAAQTLSQAGLSADKTRLALEALAKTDISPTFDNIGNTTEGVIAIMNQFDVEAQDLEATLGSLNSVAAKFAVESSDIITTIRRTGGAFKAAGGSLEELNALFTSVRQTTRESAESIATGFRTIFTRIQRTRTIKFLDDLGIQLRDVEGKFIGPYKAIGKLSSALKDLDSTDPRFSQIIEELGGFRQVSKVIPLIKEFDTAQQALIVSQQGSNSLTKDAAKAQDSLIIQITKVREEFQALVRSFGDDDTIKGMIKLALNLASSLIKVTEALKPLIPLIGLLALPKIGSGIAGSAKGVGRFLGFSKGGMVPGSGSGDTVPAVLEPGEFVLRKQAVQAIGADRVNHLNSKRFASGGMVRKRYSQRGNVTPGEVKLQNATREQITALYATDPAYMADLEKKYRLGATPQKLKEFDKLTEKNKVPKLQFAFREDLNKKINNKTTEEIAAHNVQAEATKATRLAENKSLIDSEVPLNKRTFGAVYLNPKDSEDEYSGAVTIPYKGKPLDIPYRILNVGLASKAAQSLEKEVLEPKVTDAVQSSANNMKDFFKADTINPIHIQNKSAIFGSLFESGLLALKQKERGLDDSKNNARIFDFGSGLGSLAGAFGTSGEILRNKPTDAKYNQGQKSKESLVKKVKSYYERILGVSPVKKASGGQQTGTDTVPALLTPGEYVVNKDAAKAIGLGRLNQLNKADKVAKFASGGPVKMASGGGVRNIGTSGGLIALTVLPGLLHSLEGVTDANKQLVQSTIGVFTQFTAFNLILGQVKDSFEGLNLQGQIDTRQANIGKLEGQNSQAGSSYNTLVRSNSATANQLAKIRGERAKFDHLASRYTQASVSPQFNPQQQAFARLLAGRAKGASTKLLSEELSRDHTVRQNNLQLKSLRDETTERNNLIATNRKEIESINKLNQRFEFAQLAVAGFSAAAITLGQFLQTDGINRVKKGNFSAKRQIATGSAISTGGQFAGTGAAIGTAIGAGVGTFAGGVGAVPGAAVGGALGTVGGGIAGFIKGALDGSKLADELERQFVFGENIKSFEAILEANNQNKINPRTGLGTVQRGTNLLLQNLKTAPDAGKESAQGKINDSVLKLNIFLNNLATTTKTFDEFKNLAGDALTNFAKFQEIPFDEVEKSFTNMIDQHIKETQAGKNLLAVQDRQLQRLKDLNQFTSSIKDATLSLNLLSAGLDSIDAFSGGGGGSSKFIDRSEVFGRLGAVTNNAQFNQIADQVAKAIGPDASLLASELKAVNDLAKNLPNLLAKVTADSPNDADALQKRFEEALDETLGKGAHVDFLKQSLKANLGSKILGPEQKDERFFSNLRDNPFKLSEDLLDGSLKTIAQNFQEFSQLTTEHNNRVAGLFEKQRGLDAKFLELNQKRIDNLDSQEEFNRSINHTQLTFNDANRLDNRQRGSFGVNLSAEQAGARLRELQDKIPRQDIELQNKEGEARTELLKVLADERNEVERLNKFLDFLGNAAQRNANLLKVQSQFQQERGVRRGIAEDFIFGGQDARRKLVVGAAGGAQLAQNGDINSLPAFAQSESFDFLKRLGDVKLGILGNKSGEDVLKTTITNFLKQTGVNEDDAQKIAGISISRPEQLVVDAINKKFNEANAALGQQKGTLEQIRDLLTKQIELADVKFEKEKTRLQNENKITNIDSNIAGIQNRNTGIKTNLTQLGQLKQLVGQTKPEDVIKNFGELEEIKKGREKTKGLITTDNNQSFDKDFFRKFNNVADTSLQLLPARKGYLLDNLRKTQRQHAGDDVLERLTGNKNSNHFVNDDSISSQEFSKIFEQITNNPKLGKKFAEQLQTGIIGNAKFENDGSISLTEFLKGINQSFKTIFPENQRKLDTQAKNETDFKNEVNTDATGLQILLNNFKEIEKFKDLKIFDTTKLEAALKANTDAINKLNIDKLLIQDGKLNLSDLPNFETPKLKFATGGKVPGIGNRDSVLAQVMPGEFILNKQAAAAIGDDNLFGMNKMARGGRARMTAEQFRAAKLAKKEAFAQTSLGKSSKNLRDRKSIESDKIKQRNIADYQKYKREESIRQGVVLNGQQVEFDTSEENIRPRALIGEAARQEFLRRNFNVDNTDTRIIPRASTPNNNIENIRKRSEEARQQNLANLERIKREQAEQKGLPGLKLSPDETREYFLKNPGAGLEGLQRREGGTKTISPAIPSQEIESHSGHRITIPGIPAIKDRQDLYIRPGRRPGFADGGYVPGQGNTDSVPAMLMPGEFVMTKNAVKSIGVDKLAKANQRGGKKFANGGLVESNNGGTLGISPEISQIFSRFDASVSKLATALESMPHTISMNVRLTHEVIFNGAEVLQTLQPAFQDMAVKLIEKSINNMIKEKFPDVGTMQ